MCSAYFYIFFFSVVLKYIISLCVLYILFHCCFLLNIKFAAVLHLKCLIPSNHVLGPSQYIPFAHGVTDVLSNILTPRYVLGFSLDNGYTEVDLQSHSFQPSGSYLVPFLCAFYCVS